MNNSMQKLISILKKLVTEDISSSSKKDYYINEFKKIYTESFRHMYSELLTFMLGLDREGKTELLISNLKEIYDYANKKGKISEDLLGGLRKLYDHLNMDFKRLSYMASVIDSNLELDIRIQKVSDNFNKKISVLEEEKNKLESNVMLLENIVSDAKEVKKDLVSIMGIFLGIFLFFQLNFSQLKDLLEYDPFSRIMYLIIFNIIFLIGLYLIFVIIDFLIHRELRLLKLFIDIEKKFLNNLGILCMISYIGILCICGYLLHSDNSRKTISKIENNIEEVNETLDKKIVNEINKKNEEIKDLKETIKNLENKIKELDEHNKKINKEIEDRKIKQD